MSARSRVRKQIRGFVFAWTAITLLMGACTFAAIYAAYGTLAPSQLNTVRNNAALPTNPGARAPVVIPSNTPLPTRGPTRTAATQPAAAAAQAETDEATEQLPPTAIPTLLPVDDDRFEVGIQVQVSYDLMDAWMDVASKQLGVNWVKQQVRWEDIEPEQGEYNWADLDTFLPSASKHGVKVLLSIVTAPDWAREPGISLERHGPPADPQTYADFVGAILERYPNEVHAVEVWNEMNLDREWTSTRGLSATNYVALLRATSETIKSIDPGIIVVSGALSPTGFDDGVTARDDATYFDLLIQAGMLNYADCVGAHHNGYNVSPDYTYDAIPNDPSAAFRGPFDNPHRSWSFRSTLQTYALKIENAGGDQKLCVTEFGWPSTEGLGGMPRGFEFAKDNTLQEQADFTVAALDNMREWDTVRLAFIWNLNYGPQAGYDPTNDNVPYSLIGPGTSFRPAFDAVKEWEANYEAETGQ
jgi:polysaccharide biosynthesis protein PslG